MQFSFTQSETEVDHYQEKVSKNVVSRVAERVET